VEIVAISRNEEPEPLRASRGTAGMIVRFKTNSGISASVEARDPWGRLKTKLPS